MARRISAADVDPAGLERLATSVVDTIRRDGSLAVSKLASHGVPKSARAAVLARCAHDGLEVGPRLVRVPLQDQLRARLGDGAAVAMRALSTAVQGATKKDATKAALALVASGEARLVLRGTEATLMPAATRVVHPAELDVLEKALASMIKGIKAARKARAALLLSDVQELVTRLRPAARAIGIDDVLQHARSLSLETGLTFVPALVRALGGEPARAEIHEALLAAARRGLLELRPESGLARLSVEDVALCLPGPQGSRLSWARATEEAR